jgi:subtilisin family serine protease
MIEHGRKSGGWRPPHSAALLALLLAAAIVAGQMARGSGGRPAGVAVAAAVDSPAPGLPAARARAARAPGSSPQPAPFRAGAVLLGFAAGVSPARSRAIEHAVGATDARRLGPRLKPATSVRAGAGARAIPTPLELRVPAGRVLAVVARLRRYREVAYAEPDYIMQASAVPNDPSFGLQWADSNTGQAIPTQEANEVLGAPANGTPGADDGALKAWGVTSGSAAIVIGETDTGVDYEHPDLAANIWSNPGSIGGCAAGTHGYSVVSHTCNPMDDDTVYGGHGSHVAGIMGAVGNNGVGVAGMNWHTTILPVKWLNSSAWGETSGLIEALQWLAAARQAGVNVRVVNDSATFKGTAYSQALSDEIDTLGANGILFVTAAGNTGDNNDEENVRRYPCGYDRPSEICVTATDNNDRLPSWANYGPHTVDLAAPGVSIYSTLREGRYGYLSGGSMASPQVAGAAALILSVAPSLSPQELKADIVSNVDPLPTLAGKVISGGRLDVCKALPGCAGQTQPPATATFGKTSVGASSDSFTANRKRVNRYALPTAGAVTKLSIYLTPTSTTGQQVLKGVIYADSNGVPGALAAVSQQLTFTSTNAAGWYDLVFPAPVKLAAGSYWIGAITGNTGKVAGFRYDSVTGSRDYNTNTYTSGPTNPFGSVTSDREQTSLYATYLVPPVSTKAPTIAGTAQQGQTLTEAHGSWTGEPTDYTYQWQQCDSSAANCTQIAGATNQTYTPLAGDVGHTLRVQETASNEGGASSPASSAATAVVTATATAPPSNIAPPTITGTAQEGQTLTEAHGSWTGEPTGYTYQWQQCDSSAANCTQIAGATNQTYTPLAGDVGHTLRVQETASNEGGASSPASSAATAVVTAAPTPAPTNTTPPSIVGTAAQGQTLTVHAGSWTGSPTTFAYQWLQCDGMGSGCLPIAGATTATYTPVAGDVGHTLSVQETATNAGGSSAPASSAATAKVVPPPPASSTPPTITGSAKQGQTLTATPGTWTNEPTDYAYQWQRCDTAGANCLPIAAASASTYVVGSADVGSTLRVAVTASNAGGSSAPASSLQTAIVQSGSATFGKTTVGASSDTFLADRKRVNRYALTVSGTVTKLSIYLAHTATSGQQVLKGLVYADSVGAPAALLGVSEQLTFTSTSTSGWYDLVFASPINLAAGNYWIGVITGASSGVAGFRYDSVAGARDYNANTYTSLPSNPFGAFSTDSEQTSLYATYTAG